MRILCTGASGWIGSHLCPALSDAGHEVFGIDGYDADRLETDLSEDGVFDMHIDDVSPDLVVHLAALPGRVFGEENPTRTVKMNVGMTALVAQGCGVAGARLVYVSTSEVYGPSYGRYLSETELDGLPVNLYGLTKRMGEYVAQLYAPDGLIVMRPSMPYGPYMPVGRGRAALPTFIWKAIRGESIEVHRGAERCWCYVDDLIRAMVMVIERGEGIYNVGRDDDPRSMEWVAAEACRLAGADSGLISIIDPPSIVVPVKRLSMERLRGLGFEPSVEIEDGMMRVLEHLRLGESHGS